MAVRGALAARADRYPASPGQDATRCSELASSATTAPRSTTPARQPRCWAATDEPRWLPRLGVSVCKVTFTPGGLDHVRISRLTHPLDRQRPGRGVVFRPYLNGADHVFAGLVAPAFRPRLPTLGRLPSCRLSGRPLACSSAGPGRLLARRWLPAVGCPPSAGLMTVEFVPSRPWRSCSAVAGPCGRVVEGTWPVRRLPP